MFLIMQPTLLEYAQFDIAKMCDNFQKKTF